MKTDINSLQDSFESWYTANETSRLEVSTVLNMYHNRQWDREQLLDLGARGQPKETFNIIKLLTRTLVGYYATVVNKAQVEPTKYSDITKATILNDIMKATYENTNFDTVDDDIKTYGFLTGIFASYSVVNPSGEKDIFGRNEMKLDISDVNPETLVLDPVSNKRDYSDARGIHSFKWMDVDSVKKEFGKNKTTIDKLDAYSNHLNITEAEFTYKYETEFTGKYKVDNMYLIVHSVIGEESIYWCGNVELARTKLKYPRGKTPYTITKISRSNKEEYYGIFHDVIESQKAINQAIIQLQLLVNTNKVIVETDAVENIDEFADTIARVNAVAEVQNLKGVNIVNMSQNVKDQYTIMDNAYARIKSVLGINDAMLGQAYAADSARKTKLQKNTGYMTLRYLTGPLELFHKKQGELVAGLIAENFSAHQVLRVTDDITGSRFIEINMPMVLPKLPPELAKLVSQGMPISYAFEALLTGQLNPVVMSAMQQDQMAMQQQQQYQQAQAQSLEEAKQVQQALVMQGLSPQNVQPIPPSMPPPQAPQAMASLPTLELDDMTEESKKSKINSAMTTKGTLPMAPPGLTYMYEEIIDMVTGVPETDKDGNILLVPVSQPDSMIDIKSFEVTIVPSSYDDEDEKAQLMLEVLLNGPAGEFARQASPAHYAKMISLNVQSTKTKNSPEIAKLFNDMAEAMGQNPEFQAYMRQVTAGVPPQQQQGMPTDDGQGGMLPPKSGGGPGSQSMKLPQNTNEGYN